MRIDVSFSLDRYCFSSKVLLFITATTTSVTICLKVPNLYFTQLLSVLRGWKLKYRLYSGFGFGPEACPQQGSVTKACFLYDVHVAVHLGGKAAAVRAELPVSQLGHVRSMLSFCL